MLLSREEMTFDFRGAQLHPERDARLLAWVMNQFLYGEVTGIQCGRWLYDAPDLEAARFFSRQAVEEFQHVENFLRILELVGEPPAPAHRMVRFLSTGMMPASFEEHVCLEMALGEGFHARRLTLKSSQVGRVAASQRARWDTRRRMQLALTMLTDPALDVLITGESDFDGLPQVMARLATTPGDALCQRIRY